MRLNFFTVTMDLDWGIVYTLFIHCLYIFGLQYPEENGSRR